jgi:cytochrome P450
MSVPRVDVDFDDPAVVRDPWALYEEVRSAGRVVWNGKLEGWMVPGYDDCTEVLTGRGKPDSPFGSIGARYPEVTWWFEAPNLGNTDGAEHRRLRSPMAKYFTPTYVRRWEDRIREVVDEILTPLAQGRQFDLIQDFTRIPIIIVAEMLGVPRSYHDDFLRLSHQVNTDVAFGRERPEDRLRMEHGLAELNAYLDVEIERHRREDLSDVFGAMVKATGWSDAEIRASALNLMIAGYDSTAKLMSVVVETLALHPEQRRLLAEDPTLIPNAIEEVLRWTGVSGSFPIVVRRDTELAGTELKDGECMLPMFQAANRDPAYWDDPHRFDIERPYQPNLGFGGGPHTCIGQYLARLEVQVAVEGLLRLAPDYRLRDVVYSTSWYIHGPAQGIIEVGVPAAAS